MSLQVYNKTDPPMSVIVDNDTELDSGDMCAGVLKVIDKAVSSLFQRTQYTF